MKPKNRSYFPSTLSLTFGLIAGLAASAQAQWSATPTTAAYGTAGNWVTSTKNGAFSQSSTITSLTVATNDQVGGGGSLIFSTAAIPSFTLGASANAGNFQMFSGASIQMLAGVVADQTINAGFTQFGGTGSNKFTILTASSATNTLIVNGDHNNLAVSGVYTAAQSNYLTLGGTLGTGIMNGIINNGKDAGGADTLGNLIVKRSGTANWTINGTNTYTGGTEFGNGGTGNTVLGNKAALGTGALRVISGQANFSANTALTGANAIANTFNYVGNTGTAITNTYTGITSGNSTITVSVSAGTPIAGDLITGNLLGFFPNYTRVVSVSGTGVGAVLTLSNPASLTTATATTGSTQAFNNTGAGTSTFSGSNAIEFSGTQNLTTLNSNLAAGTQIFNINGTGDITFSGVLQQLGGAASITKGGTGTGKLILSGANTYGGTTTITAGTLKLGAAGVIPDGTGKGNVAFTPASGTATLDLNGFSETINGLSSSGAGSSVVDNTTGVSTYDLIFGGNNGGGTFSGVINNTSGTIAVTKIGTGTVTLAGANSSYAGTTSIETGTLGATLNGNVGISTNSVLGNAATPVVLGLSTTVNTAAAALQFVAGNDASNYTMSRNIDCTQGPVTSGSSGSVSVNFNSDGLVGANTNTLTLASELSLGVRNSRLSVQRSGMTIDVTGDITSTATPGSFTLNAFPADPNVDGRGPGTIRFSNLSRTYTASNNLISGRVLIDGVVGATLTASPIGQAAINLSQGSGGNIIGAGNFNGGDYTRDTSVDTIRAIFLESAGNSYARAIAPGNGSLTTGNALNYVSNVGVINGFQFGGLNATGTVTFSGAISPGDVSVGGSATNVISLVANMALISQNGGTVEFTGNISDTPSATTTARVSINQFRNHPNIDGTNNAGTTVLPDGNADTFANNGANYSADRLVGSAKTGTVVLKGANTYVGGTEVLGGTLLANNTTGSATGTGAVTVATGATIGGTGSIAGATTVSGNLAPGASVGQLSLNGGLTLGAIAAGSLKYELGAPTTAGTTYDTVATSTLNIGAGVVNFASFQFTDTGTLAAGTYTLISSAAPITGTLGASLSGAIGAFTGTVSISGNNLVLTVTGGALPPYDTWAAGFSGFTPSSPALDFDNDGMSNLLEFVLGGDPRVNDTPSIRPSVTAASSDLVVTFNRSDVSEQAPAVTVKVQTSSDLVTWTDFATIGAVGGSGYTVTENGAAADTIVVTIPKAAATQKFARVVATN